MNEAKATKIEYICRSYATLKLHVSNFAQLLLGYIEGITRFSPYSKCYLSYNSIAENIGVSTRQAKRIVKKLKDEDVLEQVYDPKKQRCAYYRPKRKDEKRGFVATPLYLKERMFGFAYLIDPATGKKPKPKDDKSKCVWMNFERCLTDIEITVLSLMAAHGTFEGTVSSIARTIGKSRTSGQKAIDGLIHCGAIHRDAEETSNSRRDKSTYHVEEWLLNEINGELDRAKQKQAEQKPPKKERKEAPPSPIEPNSPQKTALQAQIEDINAKSAREHYYSVLREKAQIKSDKVKAALNSNAEYKEAWREHRTLEIALVKADKNKDQKSKRQIVKRMNALSMIMKNVREVMGYTLADTKPQYRCERCQDTGFKKDGRACTCYPKGGTT